MTLNRFGINPGFAKALVPAALGGAVWDTIGLPLGWLMGAAVVAGAFAAANVEAKVPKPLYTVSLVTLGASVGLAINPDVAAALVGWAPFMAIAGAVGILGAVLMAPVLAHFGQMDRSTAFFSLLPGGVIEMATVGERHGADRTIVSALHAVRVGLVVGLLPLILFFFFEASDLSAAPAPPLPPLELAVLMTVGLFGGWLGAKAGLPAAWLLGALILAGLVSSFGYLQGRVPEPVLAAVQVLVGLSLGSRFQRSRLIGNPARPGRRHADPFGHHGGDGTGRCCCKPCDALPASHPDPLFFNRGDGRNGPDLQSPWTGRGACRRLSGGARCLGQRYRGRGLEPPRLTSGYSRQPERMTRMSAAQNAFAEMPQDTTITADASAFVEEVRFEDLPEEAIRIGTRCIVDGVGLYVAGI